jgi:hypothetical protein
LRLPCSVVALLLEYNIDLFATSPQGKTALEDLLEDFEEYVNNAVIQSNEKTYVALLTMLTFKIISVPSEWGKELIQ